ncbi:hypothetical protein PC120_g7592 [Phytophthora cactorum]|nr:hypothetical protein PC120_g7592 [Phytophthora cactorum]
MESLLALQLYLVTFLLFLSPTNPIEPVPQAADADTVVNAGTSKSIRLDANLLIPDGGELLLNIQVPHEPIQIRPKGPAKVLRVYSDHVDGKFGVGEVINIFVKFTSPVKLSGSGSPYLVLKTGCHASSCHIKEIQRLRCMATKGKFAVGFGSQKVGNIPWDASAKVFAAYLKRMNRINKVSVKYSIDEDRACTFFGNNITVTFESMNIAGTDGDLVEMTGDATNAVGDGIVLGHVMYSPLVTPTAWEIRKGVLVPDRKALFVAQTAPDTLKFGYTVQKGDNTTALEYANSDSLALSLRAITGVRIVNDDGAYTIANTILPPPGFDGDWERGIGTSLSKNSALEIDVTPPFVKTVTSPHDDGTFGIGEEILVHVYFSQPIEVTGLPTVVLETGAVDRIIPFNQVVAGNIAEFKYIVQSMDTSPDLTYTGTTALQLNGGSIKRKSTTPTTNAVLKLPVNGETGSLSVNKNMVIDTTKPKILSVTTTAKDGVYTAGDDIRVIVTFDMPVVVTGAPQLLLSTGSVDLFPGQFVLEAPKFTSNETVVFPSYYLGLSTISSKGLQFKIDGQILTVDSVLRDEVTMIEKYTGTKVDPAALSLRANVPIYTPGYRPAKYSSGSGTKMLTFVYTVQIGDISTRLAYISTSALQLGSGSVKRLSTTPFTNADLTLAAPGTSGSLSASAVLVINTGAPRVTQVKAITRDGVYKAGDEIYFEVIFNLPVVVSPVASLLTNIASAGVERLAVSSEGSGTTSLKFKFDCQEDDQATVLDVKNVNSLRTAYGSILGWIRRKSAAPMLPAVLDLPLAGLISKGISINQGCEVVTDVSTSHEEGTYGVGESIDILVKYSASVSVDITGGVPTLVTTTGNRAVYQYGTGTKTLVFNYVVQQSDISGQVFYPDRFSLKTNGAVIKGLTSSALSSTLLPLPELSQLKIMDNLFVEILPPVVKEVSTRTQDQVITIGDTIVVFVSFNYPIYVPPLSVGAGAPTLLLNVGTGNGIASSYVAAEDFAVYFSFTVAAGQSTSKLSYFGRSALKCTGGNGLNKDPGQNAGPPTAVLFGDLFVTSWAEMSSTTNTRQIRVKSFDLQQFPPLSSFEDGGGVSSTVNFDSTMDASSPELVTFSSKLYLVWVEASTATNNPPQIRVAVLASRSNLNSPAQWTFVDAKPATNSGINKLSTANAGGPRAVVHKSKLYVAWNENPSGVAQIRVAVFNGVDIAPGWTFIDGNQNARGLNYAASQPAQNVRLCSCGSKGSTAKNLYAAWSEISTLSGTAQIRVAVQTGPDSLPNWKFIDGNAVTGLNIDTQKIAKSPSIQCTGGSSVVIGWQETTGISGSVIFIKIFNGDFTTPQWTRLDGGKGLNFDTTQPAQNLKLSIQMLGTTETLFATWDEMDSTGTATQIRVAKLLTGTTSWRFLDGGAKLSAINDDVSHATSRPILALRQSQDTVITAWLETHSNGRSHIRGSVLESSVKEWQPISQGCILRKSTTSVKSANLILPELNSPGSLDFGNSVRVETSKPTVQNVSLAGDIYSSITSVNTIQTIDVFNVASIKQGEYKLIYGNTMETSCISWNAPATGTGSIQSALQSTTGMALQVSVTQDTTAFHDGYRYTITFIFPSMGILPLQVKTAPDAKCLKFKCDPASTRFSCNLGLIQPNQNSDIRTAAGVVDAVVRFSFPVVIPTGIPKLSIDTGLTVRDAMYTTRSALQEFDVGINMASSVLGGGFRLAYGDFSSGVGVAPIYTTDCIQPFLNAEDGEQEIQSKLEEIAVINTIGIRSISRRKFLSGYRYIIEFRNSGDMLDLVPADSSTCPGIAASTQTIDIRADSEILSGEVKVQLGDTKSGCIPWNIRARGSSNSMEAFLKNLESDRIISVQVVKDPSAYVHGVKYYARFSNLVDAKTPLLAFLDPTCAVFTCNQINGAAGACTGLSVTSNADFTVTRAESESISFRYVAQSSDEATSLTYKSSSSLTGTILRSSMNPILTASLTLPPPTALVAQDGVTSMAVVRSDKIPVVSRVYSSTNDDTYTAGDVIIVLVEFSEKVLVVGKPILELNSKGEALYISGSGTNVLKFYYEIQSGEASADLNYASEAALRTFTFPISKITCALCSGSGIDADTTLPALASATSLAGNNALVVDTTIPIVALISSSRADTAIGDIGYGPGDIVDIIVTFSTVVSVTGTPSLTLNSGGKAKFTYAGYRQLVDIGVNAVVPVTSGQFAIVYDGEISGCIDFDDASSTAATSLKSRLLEFKAIARIGILSVTMTKKKNGNRFEVLFDSTKVVDVPLSIELAISDMCDPLQPSSAAQETLISRTTDNQIVFHYSVGVGDTAAVLNVVSTSITLNPGTASILRQSGSPVIVANVALPASTSPQNLAQTKTLKIDGTPATISDIISDSAVGTYGVGFPTVASPLTVAPGEILFHLGFTRPVAVIGIPTVELATGSLRPSGEFIPNRFAKFVNQPQPNQVAFLYHIEPDDYSTNLAFPSVNVLSGANIYCVSSTMSVRASLILPKLTISNGIIKIDAYSVPAAVKLASSHKDGVYGAGELIEIQVSFSKQIVLLSGLNRNQDWHARYPVALEFKRDIYIMWTERDDMHAPTKSFLYLRVFSSDTLDVVPITSVSAINRVPNTFIQKVAMTVWKQNLYAAWDEGGLLYCALFEGIPSINPWTLIPNMGINKNMAMAASDPVLLVYNLELVVVWREKALPVGSSALVGQIRVAVFNYETDAPLWIFHDGNQLDSGLNKNKLMDADDPVAVVYRGRMYVSWTEMNSDGAYEIVIARRNIQTRDFSTWTYLDALPSTYPAYSFLSAYKPQFAVRRRGIEDMSLLVSWYRDTVTSNVSEVITGQVLDLDWEASVTGSIPQTINAAEASTTVNNVNPNSIEQKFVTCGDNIYSSWLDLEGNNDDAAYVVKLATLPSGADVYTGWTQAVNQSNMNHNPKRDVMDSFLVCSTSSTVNSLPGLVWTEYDGYSIKLRFRHYALVPRTPGATSTTYGETIAGAPVLMLATQSNPLGYAACIDKSGLTTTMLSFTYMVQPGESSPQLEILGQDALKLNGAVIRDISGKDPDFTLFPDSANLRSLSYNSKLAISTTPPTVISVTSTNPSGEYGVGQVLEIQVTFSGPVVVVKGDPASPPTLSLRSDDLHLLTSSQGIATYAGGSGSSVLTFEYTTVQQDYCEQLDYMDTASLALNGSTWAIKRNATRPTTDAVLTLPPVRTANSLSGSRTIVIKPTQPSVVKVTSSTPDGTYYPGDIILVDVIFSLPVVVFGFPVLLLKTGGDTATRAFLKSGNGTVKLTFEYDIKIGDKSARLDVVDDRIGDDQAYFVMSLLLEGYAEIKRASTNPFTIAVTALPAPGLSGSLSFSKIIIVDSTPPTVIDIRSAAVDGTYDIGEQVDVSLIFSHAVVVTGIPEIILNVPSEYSRTAVYTDGSGTNILRFSYFPKEGDNSRNLALDILDENSLILRPLLRGKELLQNPAEILCRSSNPVLRADIKLPIPGVASCTVTLAVGDVEFRKAIYIGGSTTTKLEFEYVIQYGDHSSRLDYIGANSLQCTILQSTAVPSLQASNTLRLPGALGSLSFNSALRIDALSPRITSVSSGSANGVYGAGQVIDIAITFSEAILVPSGATPRLMLAIASNTAVNALLGISFEPYATYTGGSGTNILQFAYSVRVGDMALPLEYAGIDALSLTIQSAQLTAVGKKYRYASMRLPVPGATGSLSNNRDIHIDTLEPPRVISVGSLMADGIYTAGDTLTISVTFSTPVIVSGSPPMLLLNTGNPDTSNTDKKAVYVSGSGSSVLLFAYKVHIGDNVDRLEYKPCPVAERSAFIQRKWDKLVRCSSTSNALQLGGISSSIKRSSTVPVTDAVLDLPEVNDWAELRVVTTDGDVVYVTQIEPTTGTEKNELPILENEFSISHQRAAINIYSNGLPSHDTNLYEKIKEQKYFIELQRFPTLQSQALNLSRIADAFSGVFLNGVLFKNSNKSAKSTDECGGAIDADGHYFYVNLPTCFLAAIHEPREAVVSLTGQITRPPSVIVAYALDGFPIYGYYDENGELPSDLDECHGHMRRDGQYAYHLVPPTTSASPFIPCLKGIASPSQLSVFRYPADISAIEGLSLSELTKFNSFVIDENPGIYQVDTWLNPDNVSVVYTSTSVIVRSNGVPSGSYGPFPNAYNRYSVYEQDYIFQFPRSPVSAATTTSLPRDIPIGVMVNGVPFFAANSDFYGGIVVDTKNPSYKLLDKCNGLVDTGGDYRYYASPDCLLHELGDKAGQPSPLIGFAFDGFPLYGPYGENGQTPNDLDACNGRVGEDGTYRYHVTLGAPYLLGCFRGNPSIDQKNLDAASDLYRSLSYAHALRINTDRPQITHVFTNKRPGVYVTGESVDVVVEWSTPVQVVGIPSLSIQNSSRVATYDASRSSKTQTVFLYLVKTDDVNLEDFSYDAHAAIQLNGGRIARFATIPVLDADLELTPSDLHDIALIRSRTSGISSKFQLVRDLRVVLRGLYHPRAQDLRARVFHGNRESIIFDGCCTTRDAFGVPDVPNVLTNRAQLASEARNPTSGVGWDYSFSDFEGVKNLALNGGATALQSSISGTCGPMNAIDGRIRGVSVSRQTVARTLPANDVKESSWWELRLVDVATIGTIRIWIADNDPSVPVDVFILRVNSSDGISAVTGYFTLTFTTQDNKQLETESVSHNAVAMIADEKARVTASGIGHGESIQAKLLALGDVVPRLLITREPRDAALSRNGAFTWHITFLDNPRAVLSVGVNNVCGGTGVVKIGAPLSIDDDSDPIVYRNEESSKPSAGTSVRDTEQSMFPFWVLLFDSSAVMDVESFADAYARAIFSYRVDERHTNRSVISVVPPLGTKAQYVRLVAELPRGVLSIAEVEVFTEQNHVLSQYAGGTPVRTAYHPGGKTWSPEEPFRYTFRGMPSEGSWTLAIVDMAVNGSNLAPPRPNSTAGGISDWVLYFTNQAGETVSYFMDFQAQLHALPRHGTLYVGLDETERDHLDIDGNGLLDSIEADAYLRRYSPNTYADLSANIRDRELKEFMLSYEEYGAVQVLRDASERQLRLPSSVCDAECLAAIKLDPYFYVGLEGDKALKLLRVIGERVVKYVPDAGFRGLDAFTFSVAVTGQESRVLGTIQLTVKECEDPECRMSSFLLHRSTR